MKLLQAWKESLLIFKPSNFKLFLFVSLKSILETYKLFFYYFWWFILILLLFMVSYFHIISFPPRQYSLLGPIAIVISFLFWVFYYYVFILIARTSVERKDLSYFGKYLFSSYFFTFVIVFLIFQLGQFISHTFFSFLGGLNDIINFIIDFIALNVFAFIIFFGLFLLDSGFSGLFSIIKSILRSIKMIIYNYPFLIIFILVTRLLHMGLVLLLLFPIPICILTNFYIMQVHKHFEFYFGKRPSEK